MIRVRLQAGQRLGGRLEQKAMAPRSTTRGTPRYQPTAASMVGQSGLADMADMVVTAALPAATDATTGAIRPIGAGRGSSGGRARAAGTGGHMSPSVTYPVPRPSRESPLREEAALARTSVSRAARVNGGMAAPSAWSSFLLGAGFSLAFCPTLFVLFFGATITIAARSAEGFTFPAFFALGTVVPLILFVGLALAGSRAAERLRSGMRRVNKPLRWASAALLVLLGLHDTLVYWFL